MNKIGFTLIQCNVWLKQCICNSNWDFFSVKFREKYLPNSWFRDKPFTDVHTFPEDLEGGDIGQGESLGSRGPGVRGSPGLSIARTW